MNRQLKSRRIALIAALFLVVIPAAWGQSNAFAQIEIVSGNNQLTQPSQPSAPMVVRVTSQGEPLPGFRVNWAVSPSTLGGNPVSFFANGSVTVTGPDGTTSNVVTMVLPVTHTVTVTVPEGTVPAIFTLTNRLANNTILNENERQVAAAVDQACPALVEILFQEDRLTPEQGDLLGRCSAMVSSPSSASLKNAYDQVAREEAAIVARNATETAIGQRDNIEARLTTLRGGGGTRVASLDGLTVALNGKAVPLAMMASQGGGGDVDVPRGGFYINGNIAFGEREARAGDFEKGFDFDSQSVTAGVDFSIGPKRYLGVALGFSSSDSDLFDDRGGLEVEGYNLSVYASHNITDNFFLDGIVTFGKNDYDSSTAIDYALPDAFGGVEIIHQVATGDTEGDMMSVSVSAGYDVVRGSVTWQTYAQLTATDLTIDAYDEQMLAGVPGFGLGLHVNERDIKSRTAVLGESLSFVVSTSWGVIIPNLRVEWERELEDEARTISTFLLNDPNQQTIELLGDPLDADQLNVGLGFSAVFKGGNQIFLHYEKALQLDRIEYESIDFGFRFEF